MLQMQKGKQTRQGSAVTEKKRRYRKTGELIQKFFVAFLPIRPEKNCPML
jgi:hypothetical protein